MQHYPEAIQRGFSSALGRTGRPFAPVCLAPRRVFRAPFLAVRAVGFYPAFSPVPFRLSYLKAKRWFVFCDTVRQKSLSPLLPGFIIRYAAMWCSDFPLTRPVSQPSKRSSRVHAFRVARGNAAGNRKHVCGLKTRLGPLRFYVGGACSCLPFTWSLAIGDFLFSAHGRGAWRCGIAGVSGVNWCFSR